MTTATVTRRPEATEHNPYFAKYIVLATEPDAIQALERQMADALTLLRAIPETKGDHRYGPDKWTIKEVLGHVIDCERVFAYRALRFARKDQTPLPGFDENVYAPAGEFGRLTLKDLVDEWDLVRRSNLAFFRNLPGTAWDGRGKANDNPITVRALAWIIAGHGRHHMEILKTRYL